MDDRMLSLCMIVRDEAANLEECLQSVKEQVDEIIIVDTGSKDETLSIARKFTSQIYEFTWEGDFCAARNFALSKANGEWILYLDADEKLSQGNYNLHQLISSKENIEAYFLPLVNCDDNQASESTFLVLRLFRNNGSYSFQGKIHEQIIIHDPAKVDIAEQPVIYHKSLSKKERNHKRSRNLELLKQAIADEPDNPFLQYYLGVEWLMLAKPAKALPFLKYAYNNIPQNSVLFLAPTIKYLSLCYKFIGEMDEALIICMEGVKQFPQYTDLFFLAGCIFEEQQEWSLAVKWIKAAIDNGQSPAIYSRIEGSDSYAAYYHLGYCQAKLRLYQEAIVSWENAIKSNPQYLYPLFNLFLLLMEIQGPEHTWLYFKNNIDLENSAMVSLIADLFFKSGYPDWANKLIDLCQKTTDKKLLLAKVKYLLFSGQTELFCKMAETVPKESMIVFYRGLVKFLLNDLNGMKKEIIALWKEKVNRDKARLLLALKNKQSMIKDEAFAGEAFNTLIECLKFLPVSNTPQYICARMDILINRLKEIILLSGEAQVYALQELYNSLVLETQSMLEQVYPGGLGVGVYE